MHTSERRPVTFDGSEVDVIAARDVTYPLGLTQEGYAIDITNRDVDIVGNPQSGMRMTVTLVPIGESFYDDFDEDGNRQFPVVVAEDPSLLFLVYDRTDKYWFLACGGTTHCQRCRDREALANYERPFNPDNPFGDEEGYLEAHYRRRMESDEQHFNILAEEQQIEDEYRQQCELNRRADEAREAAEEEEEDRLYAERLERERPKYRWRMFWRWLLRRQPDDY